MEFLQHVLGQRTIDGKTYDVVRNYFIYPKENHMAKAHSHFTKLDRKIARLNSK